MALTTSTAPAPGGAGQHTPWETSFRHHVADLPETLSGPSPSHEVASQRMRSLVRSGLLKHTDVRDAPEHFFLAHSVLSEFATRLGPGFGIRFTVQFNLFAGTVTATGGPGELARPARDACTHACCCAAGCVCGVASAYMHTGALCSGLAIACTHSLLQMPV